MAVEHKRRVFTVYVPTTGFSEDRVEGYVIIASNETNARGMGVLEAKADYPEAEVIEDDVEVYELTTDTTRVLGRLVPEDER